MAASFAQRPSGCKMKLALVGHILCRCGDVLAIRRSRVTN
jgi:hypothetical protein